MPSISINPSLTVNAPGLFSVRTSGGVQGAIEQDPVARQKILAALVSSSATAPMWGGLPITTNTPSGSSDAPSSIIQASGYAGVTGFSVVDQSMAAIQSPESPVPLSAAGMGFNYCELGSGVRLWVPASAGVAAALQGVPTNTQVSWDFVNNVLLAFSVTALPVKVIRADVGNSYVVSYNSGTGFATWTPNGSAVLIEI